jgi:hypothetical protein
MANEARPTNDRIVTLLEAISRQLGEIRDAQVRMATDLEKVTQTGR